MFEEFQTETPGPIEGVSEDMFKEVLVSFLSVQALQDSKDLNHVPSAPSILQGGEVDPGQPLLVKQLS